MRLHSRFGTGVPVSLLRTMRQPIHLILSSGTRIVTRNDANRIGGQAVPASTGAGALIPARAVGVITQSPTDAQHAYKVRFNDGAEAMLRRNECSILKLVVAGWPVQFLPAANPLLEEALAQAVEKNVTGMSVWVFTAEHLAAIALQTGRAKDKARLLQFVENGALDPARFQAILSRHGLQPAWQRFEKQFLIS